MIVGLAFICTDIYFLIINKNIKLFLKEFGIKILPIFIGALVTFFIQYMSSGDFFKMFEVHSKFWNHTFQYPKTITDWSTESYGMNIFSIFCIVIPTSLLAITYLLKHHESKMIPSVSLFSPETRKQYLFSFAMIYFVGNFLFVFLTQGGNLNGLHRYILASPIFYIFLFILASKIRSITLRYRLGMLIPLAFFGYLSLIHGPYQHAISFLDMGFFLLVFTMVYFVLFDSIKTPTKIGLLAVIILCNTVWLTYLFNHFLNNSFIIA